MNNGITAGRSEANNRPVTGRRMRIGRYGSPTTGPTDLRLRQEGSARPRREDEAGSGQISPAGAYLAYMDKDVVVILSVVSICLLLVGFVVALAVHQQKQNTVTQRQLTDQDLLRLLDQQPDGYLSPHMLAEQSGLTLQQARTRLGALMQFGVLNRSANKRGRFFYSLGVPLAEPPDLELSPDPFLTVEDLLTLFEHYGYRLTPQNLIMATGLPLSVVKREMKHFEKEGIVQMIYRHNAGTATTIERQFVLQEPYRSDPAKFRARAGKLDLELREILLNDNLIV